MNIVDILLLLMLAYGAYVGYTKGLLTELVNTGSFLLGIFLGIRFWQKGAEYLGGSIQNVHQLVPLFGFLLVFIVILLGVRLVGKIVKVGIDKTLFGSFDKILGALLGIIKWIIGVGSFLWVIQKYPIVNMEVLYNKSVVCKYVAYIIPKLLILI
jgi:membrane protein required for colicin V production